jgi:hypothetical protein
MTPEFQEATLGQRQNGILDRKTEALRNTLMKQMRRNKLQFHPARSTNRFTQMGVRDDTPTVSTLLESPGVSKLKQMADGTDINIHQINW